jgi:ubiquinone/menaquinone biosynthesis C-methylase UbiE
MSSQADPRKREEAEFHDKLRGLYEKDPERYAYYTSNKKFYSVTDSSIAFYIGWLRQHAAGKRVLDFGCGHGPHTAQVASVAKHFTGIDISPDSVKVATENAAAAGLSSKTTFLVMDGENMSFAPGSFDIVSVSGVLHHMDMEAALGQIRKVLSPDGKAIFLEALADNPFIGAYRRYTPHLRTAWETAHILHSKDAKTMRKYFKHVQVRTFHLAVLAAVPLRGTRIFGAARTALDMVDAVILRVPGVRSLGWMACFLLYDPV